MNRLRAVLVMLCAIVLLAGLGGCASDGPDPGAPQTVYGNAYGSYLPDHRGDPYTPRKQHSRYVPGEHRRADNAFAP